MTGELPGFGSHGSQAAKPRFCLRQLRDADAHSDETGPVTTGRVHQDKRHRGRARSNTGHGQDDLRRSRRQDDRLTIRDPGRHPLDIHCRIGHCPARYPMRNDC